MTFFQKNRQRYSQHRFPRRGGGYTAPQITLHTYEAPHTRTPLAGATWLLQRGDPGSYHALCGSRSARDVLQLAPWSHETWHSTPNNNWAIGISAMMYAAQWNRIPTAARNNLVNSMAYASSLAAKWLQRVHGRTVQARVLTRAQAMRKESGFVTHATMDPGRRSDPGRDFPMQQFLAEFRRLMGDSSGSTPTVPEAPKEPVMSASDIWNSRPKPDYVNPKSPSRMVHRVSRAHEYGLATWQRIRQTAWRTWLAQGIWGRRIKPESSVANRYPSIRDDGYRASTWVQYAYAQARQAREQSEQNAIVLQELAKALEGVAKGEGEHIYDAVAEAIAEHDQRQVQIDVSIAEAENADPEEADTDAPDVETLEDPDEEG